MKNLLASLFPVLVASYCFAAPPQSVSVTQTSTAILPKRGITTAAAWNTNTVYAQGAYVLGGSGSNMIYMALAGGTSSTNTTDKPVHAHGSATEGTVTWYRVEPGPRLGYTFYNSSTNVIWMSAGDTAVINKGMQIAATSGDDTKGVTSAVLNLQLNGIVVGDTTNTVMFQEW